MINRAAVVVRLKQPAIDWINRSDPYLDGAIISLESVNQERTVYLVDECVADSDISLNDWLKANYEEIFEKELCNWYVDESLWPTSRSFKDFEEWFSAECHSMVVDTMGTEIEDDEDEHY